MQITTQSKTAYNRKNISCDDKSPLKLITYDILHIFDGLIPYLLAIAFAIVFVLSFRTTNVHRISFYILMLMCIEYIHKTVK